MGLFCRGVDAQVVVTYVGTYTPSGVAGALYDVRRIGAVLDLGEGYVAVASGDEYTDSRDHALDLVLLSEGGAPERLAINRPPTRLLIDAGVTIGAGKAVGVGFNDDGDNAQAVIVQREEEALVFGEPRYLVEAGEWTHGTPNTDGANSVYDPGIDPSAGADDDWQPNGIFTGPLAVLPTAEGFLVVATVSLLGPVVPVSNPGSIVLDLQYNSSHTKVSFSRTGGFTGAYDWIIHYLDDDGVRHTETGAEPIGSSYVELERPGMTYLGVRVNAAGDPSTTYALWGDLSPVPTYADRHALATRRYTVDGLEITPAGGWTIALGALEPAVIQYSWLYGHGAVTLDRGYVLVHDRVRRVSLHQIDLETGAWINAAEVLHYHPDLGEVEPWSMTCVVTSTHVLVIVYTPDDLGLRVQTYALDTLERLSEYQETAEGRTMDMEGHVSELPSAAYRGGLVWVSPSGGSHNVFAVGAAEIEDHLLPRQDPGDTAELYVSGTVVAGSWIIGINSGNATSSYLPKLCLFLGDSGVYSPGPSRVRFA